MCIDKSTIFRVCIKPCRHVSFPRPRRVLVEKRDGKTSCLNAKWRSYVRCMANIYRPRPVKNGLEQFVSRTVIHDGVSRRIAFDPSGEIDSIVSEAATTIGQTRLAQLSEPAYVRGGLRFQTWCHHKSFDAAAGYVSRWLLPPVDVQRLFLDFLSTLGADLKESIEEKEVWHVDAKDDERLAEITEVICGTFHLYAAAVNSGLYPWSNPFEIPKDQRVTRRLPGPAGGSADRPVVTPRFRFRIPMGSASTLRTDSRDMLRDIVPALVRYSAPTPIIMMIKTMIVGLARIREQANLSILDWWEESEFGEAIATTSKGTGRRRIKAQRFTPEHREELHVYFDGDRRRLDANGWGIEEWTQFLRDPTVRVSVRRRAAANAPLFPTARGGFYSRSGILDYWYRPAMKAAGLPTRTHYIRHCGVNDFLAYIEARSDLTHEEKEAARITFARDMGWRWPLAMLEHYSLPQRKDAEIAASSSWLRDRHDRLNDLRKGLGNIINIKPESITKSERDLSRLVRHRVAMAA